MPALPPLPPPPLPRPRVDEDAKRRETALVAAKAFDDLNLATDDGVYAGYTLLAQMAAKGVLELDVAEFLRKCFADVLNARAKSKAPPSNVLNLSVLVQEALKVPERPAPRYVLDVAAESK